MSRSATLAAAATLMLALAGCASADKNASASASSSSAMNMSSSATSSGSAGGVEGSNSAMPSMSSGTTTIVNAKGVPVPVPVKTIGTGYWKQMKITAQTMTPVPFYIDNGTSTSEVKPTKKTSFHLMVMLSDRYTGVAIPYATVWATIYKNNKLVFNEQQWAMLSEYMGPHYGNNVTLPGAGTYKLKLQITAPEAAMHVEYDKMWIGTHTITSTFTWNGEKQDAQSGT
jgi:uncharacterized protein involved in high-affinity Fe2+ transport